MFYIQQDDKIVLFDEDKQRLQNTIAFMPQYADLEIQETSREIILLDNEFVFADEHQEEISQKEAERIARLHLTRGDVFRGLLMAKGVTRNQIRQIIENLPEENQQQSITKEMALIDFDEALEFYRGVSLIDAVGLQLGITPEQMTRFFETNDYHELIAKEQITGLE